MSTIYGLVDPRSGLVRYVGATKKLLRQRLAEHLYTANERTYRGRWVRSLIAAGVTPEIIPLEIVSLEELWSAEVRWIAQMRADGHRLVNTGPGGEGRSGPMSLESRQRMSVSRKGKPKSATHRTAISAAKKGQKAPPRPEGWGEAHAAKLRGRQHSEETRRQMSESRLRMLAEHPELAKQVGKYERSDEHRQRMSEALLRTRAAQRFPS